MAGRVKYDNVSTGPFDRMPVKNIDQFHEFSSVPYLSEDGKSLLEPIKVQIVNNASLAKDNKLMDVIDFVTFSVDVLDPPDVPEPGSSGTPMGLLLSLTNVP